jgi:hypothetical protein
MVRRVNRLLQTNRDVPFVFGWAIIALVAVSQPVVSTLANPPTIATSPV